MPFREDINISVGQSDGLIKVCMTGRAIARQVFVYPTDPLDEPFYKQSNTAAAAPPVKGGNEKSLEISEESAITAVSTLLVEDLLSASASSELRTELLQSRAMSGVSTEMKTPLKIKLEYPDPFAEGVDEDSYVEVEPGGGKAAPAKGAPPAAVVVTRRQSRKLTVSCAKVLDGRPNSASGGSYEVILSDEAAASGFFVVVGDKGSVGVGADAVVEVQCSLPTPKGIGGLQVGSWQTFNASVVLKGGWKLDGMPEEVSIPFLLSAYVRL